MKQKMVWMCLVCMVMLSGCNTEERENTNRELSKGTAKQEIVMKDQTEKMEINEVAWQMTEAERMSFETLMTGIYWNPAIEARLEDQGEINAESFTDQDKYGFMISFLQGMDNDTSYLPFSISNQELTGTQGDIEMILESAVGSSFEADLESALWVNEGYVREVEEGVYCIHPGDGEDFCDIEIISGEQIDDERIRIQGKVDKFSGWIGGIQRYDISAVLRKNDDSVFGGYTLETTQYLRRNLTWQETYAATLLLGYTGEFEDINTRFWGMQDFDGDGTPELLLPTLECDNGIVEATNLGEERLSDFSVYYYSGNGISESRVENGPYVVYYDIANGYVLTCNQEVRATPVIAFKYDRSGFQIVGTAWQEEDMCTEVHWKYPEELHQVMETPEVGPFDALSDSYTTFTYYDIDAETLIQVLGVDREWVENFCWYM